MRSIRCDVCGVEDSPETLVEGMTLRTTLRSQYSRGPILMPKFERDLCRKCADLVAQNMNKLVDQVGKSIYLR